MQTQTNGQKAKIVTDTQKLIDHEQETVELLGNGYEVRRWVLLTPDYDNKDLVKVARSRSEEIRGRSLAWCHESFEIVIHSDRELFAAQLPQLYGYDGDSIQLNSPALTEDEVKAQLELGLEAKLLEKLVKSPDLAADEGMLEGYMREVLFDYVYGAAQIEELEQFYSPVFTAIKKQSDAAFRGINRRSASETGDAAAVARLEKDLTTAISNAAPALSRDLCLDLSRHFTATWFIDCPLKFKESVE